MTDYVKNFFITHCFPAMTIYIRPSTPTEPGNGPSTVSGDRYKGSDGFSELQASVDVVAAEDGGHG